MALPQAARFDLLDESLYQQLLGDVSFFAAQLRVLPKGSWAWVDEVQRLPALLNEVHRFIEQRSMKFALTGSSARKLRRAGVNLLGGRALKRYMFPLVPEELGSDFDLVATLRFGSLPVVWTSDSKKETLQAYVQTYLKEEIQAEALVRNLGGFARFLPVAALFHGQLINVAAVARDAGVSRPTVSGYLDVLEDTLLAFRLQPFEARLRVRERKHPKLYWLDAGVVRAVKRQLGPIAPEEKGPLFEGWLAMLLRAYGACRELFDEWYYWSPAETNNTEVNFLLERDRRFLAIEAKAKVKVSSPDYRGLRAIASLKDLERRIVVYLGAHRLQTEDGIEVWPVDEFLRALQKDSLW